MKELVKVPCIYLKFFNKIRNEFVIFCLSMYDCDIRPNSDIIIASFRCALITQF